MKNTTDEGELLMGRAVDGENRRSERDGLSPRRPPTYKYPSHAEVGLIHSMYKVRINSVRVWPCDACDDRGRDSAT